MELELPESLEAPIESMQSVGTVRAVLNGKTLGETEVYAVEGVERISPASAFKYLFESFFGCRESDKQEEKSENKFQTIR